MAGDIDDPRRREPAFDLGERDMLEAWLEFHRVTLLLKCEGLDDVARKSRPVESSNLSLHGLVRHMAEVELSWFCRVLESLPDTPFIWADEAIEDSELVPLDNADWEDDLAAWYAQCAASRRVAATHDLNDTGDRGNDPCSLRWIYTHMIEEYARHNGHADIIREILDGQVGW